MPTYPDDTHPLIRAARFVNILDDDKNALSPTKMNVWSANVAVISAAVMTCVAWLYGHAGSIGDLWAPIGGWLTQAHATNHFSKKEKNLQETRLTAIGEGVAPENKDGK